MSSKLLRGLFWTGTALAGMAIVNAEIARRVDPLDPAGPLDGEAHYYQWSLGRVFYTVKGQGSPLVLIHGFGVGVDSYEWCYVFETLSDSFRVYAYDQLGFGLSDRPDITYKPDLYVRLQRDFLRDVVGGAAVVMSNGIAGAHTVLAANLYPTLFGRVVLIHPINMKGLLNRRDWQWTLAHTLLRSPVLGEMLVNIISSRHSIRRQLRENSFYDADTFDENLIDAYYMSSHQPGARHAIAACLTGYLDIDVRLAFAGLKQPVWVVWGKDSKQVEWNKVDHFMAFNSAARMIVFENTGQNAAIEQPEELIKLIQGKIMVSSPKSSGGQE